SRRKRHHPALVGFLPRVVGDGRAAPGRLNRGVAGHTRLRDEPIDHAERAAVVVEAVLDQIIKTTGAERRPAAMDFDDERSLARLELRAIDGGCALGQRRRIAKLRLLARESEPGAEDE